MLFQQRLWLGIADGSITVAFRRWRRPSVQAGGALKSPVGLLAIETVEPIPRHGQHRSRHPGWACEP